MPDENEPKEPAGIPPENVEAGGAPAKNADVAPETDRETPIDPASDKGFDEAAYLAKVAAGEIPFGLLKGNEPGRYTYYARAMSGYLAELLHMDRKAVVTLALAHLARSLTHQPTTTMNDLGVLTQGLQFVVEDLTAEAAEWEMLTIRAYVREAAAGERGQKL